MNIPTKNESHYQDKWKKEVSTSGERWHFMFALCAICVYPLWSLFDYFLVPDMWLKFCYLRVGGSMTVLLYTIIHRTFKLPSVILGYVTSLVMYLSIDLMMPFTGKAMWFYSLGFSTAFITTAMLTHWKVVHSVITTAVAVLGYALMLIGFSNMSLGQIIGEGAALTFTVAIISIVLVWNRMRLSEREFIARVQMMESQHELQTSLGEVQMLKDQQDGDYYLTSLLIKPLSKNQVVSASVNVQFMIHQKKKFEFRHWSGEIGGDICIAHNIVLKKIPFVVFMNADAMGKSIQGAGGAIVAGVVFQAMIERTKFTAEAQDQSPEQWIESVFFEMHKVFQSFDGSMIISMALGLIDEDTGMLYYINAEHPWSILYRNNRAQFIEKELLLGKIGTEGIEKDFRVQHLIMKPGDILIVGSDGRDDIIINDDLTVNRLKNADENLFLQSVENSAGDLPQIYESLLKSGEITDDLSMLRIGYRENEAVDIGPSADNYSASELINGSEETLEQLKKLIFTHFRNKEFVSAALYGECYIYSRPNAVDVIFITSLAFKMLKNFSKAIQLAEKVRILSPEHLRNLIHLTNTCILVRDYANAEVYLREATLINAEDERTLRLQHLLNKAQTASAPRLRVRESVAS